MLGKLFSSNFSSFFTTAQAQYEYRFKSLFVFRKSFDLFLRISQSNFLESNMRLTM